MMTIFTTNYPQYAKATRTVFENKSTKKVYFDDEVKKMCQKCFDRRFYAEQKRFVKSYNKNKCQVFVRGKDKKHQWKD